MYQWKRQKSFITNTRRYDIETNKQWLHGDILFNSQRRSL